MRSISYDFKNLSICFMRFPDYEFSRFVLITSDLYVVSYQAYEALRYIPSHVLSRVTIL